MGLDVALGVVILIAAIRGWLQGFVYQAIRLAGLVACIYLAAPVREQAKPYVVAYLPTIPPEWLDRLLWWSAAAISYVVLVGVTTLAIKMTRRPEIPGIPAPSSRNDQFAGFLLGAAKGALVAAFMTAGIQKYALNQVAAIPWAEQQVKTSMALQWNAQYQPAAKIWLSPPVQHVVIRVQRMGLSGPGQPIEKAVEQPVVQTASRATDPPEAVETSKFPKAASSASAEMVKAVEEINAAFDARGKGAN
jgi:uncharacterized membrane protein required for colicin V production